ncbi:MAG: acetylornithine/succinylornithine family transaminase [Treponema sp.]|jgi:acetylornithine/N-succinyldiaminopimelate aminotransferase|nr:acetylornithine/succinylornithine family transaminase [Treponema sp.]
MNDVFMNTFHRMPVTFAKGEGALLTGINGKQYIDFTAGIAVNCLGHAYPPLVKAIADQAAKIIHTCNYYMSDTSLLFAQKLVAACAGAGMKNVFLGNSGAEANEGAIKIARKYSLAKYGEGRHTIVALKGSFHGRTITTLSATGQDVFHKNFGPFTEGFTFITANDIDALEKALDRAKVAAFMVEAIQGESGIRSLSDEYVAAAVKLCEERDILFIFDEIQTGVGRTGTFLACEGFGVKPDIVTIAKGLSGGVPVGAVLAGAKAADVFVVGDHGSTFGGNPLAAAAGIVVLDTVAKPAFLREITRKGEKICSTIASWNHPKVSEIRSRGLMIGVDITVEAAPVLEAGIAHASDHAPGLLMVAAGKQTLRFLPPYVISDREIEQGLDILKTIL